MMSYDLQLILRDVFKCYYIYFTQSLMSGTSFCPKPLVKTGGLKGKGMEGKGEVRALPTQGLTPVHPYLHINMKLIWKCTLVCA